MAKWAFLGVEGHFVDAASAGVGPWADVADVVRKSMARLVGARPVEVAVMGSLTNNLHLLMAAFYRPAGRRRKILIEGKAFPSDLYACSSQILHHGLEPSDCLLQVFPRDGEDFLRTEDIELRIAEAGGDLALVMLGGVQYYTGQAFDMARITAAAHAAGARCGFDCAHAAGNLDLRLHDWNVDFACWCSYKYLNAGPGGIAGLFVHERFAEETLEALPRFVGWWGTNAATRFRMDPEFDAERGAASFELSNPSVTCMATLRASLDLFDLTSMEELVGKQRLLTGFLERIIALFFEGDVRSITPPDPSARGCQLSLEFSLGAMSMQKVHEAIGRDAGVVCDLRKPNVMRIAPAPMYNRFIDIVDFACALRVAVDEEKRRSIAGGSNASAGVTMEFRC
jgi:kynureninase